MLLICAIIEWGQWGDSGSGYESKTFDNGNAQEVELSGGADLSLCTQQECLFRGDGVVPLVSVTFLQEKCGSVRSTLNICRQKNKQIDLQSIKTLKPFLSTDRNTSDQMIRMDNLLCLVWNCIFVEHTPGLKTLTHSFYLKKAFSIIKRNLIVLNESSSFIYAFQQTEEMMYLKTLPGWIKRAFLY